jgi:hypothetical protein
MTDEIIPPKYICPNCETRIGWYSSTEIKAYQKESSTKDFPPPTKKLCWDCRDQKDAIEAAKRLIKKYPKEKVFKQALKELRKPNPSKQL